MTRPEIPEEERLSCLVTFRLTQRDYEAYEKKFKAAGVNKSQFFRDNVLTNKTQVVAKSSVPAVAERACFLLAKASNNINQLAHRINSANLSGALSEETFISIASQLETLNRFMLSQTEEAQG